MSAKSNTESDIAKTLGLDHRTSRRRRLKRWLIVIFLVVAVAAVVIIIRRDSHESGTTQFETQQAKRGNLVVLVTATGTLQPTNEVEVGSEISGIVKSVEADYNDKVKVSQVLARIDTSKLEAQETQLKAALEAAKARVLQAKSAVSIRL
jgi:HlyD family secretion protein